MGEGGNSGSGSLNGLFEVFRWFSSISWRLEGLESCVPIPLPWEPCPKQEVTCEGDRDLWVWCPLGHLSGMLPGVTCAAHPIVRAACQPFPNLCTPRYQSWILPG